jgi:translation initiation factor IF-2
MSKRVYEIAREQSLESKEVIQRLKEAGVEVKSHSSSVEDSVYERVFGAGPRVETPNGRSAAQEAEAQEARADAERSGHGASMAEAPTAEPISGPQQTRPQKKRRRVVIDASARNRGARPAAPAAPAPNKEPERAPVEDKESRSSGVRVEPGATVKDLGDAVGVPPTQIIKVLMGLGEMKTLTQTLSTEEIELVSEELGVEVEIGVVEEPEPGRDHT